MSIRSLFIPALAAIALLSSSCSKEQEAAPKPEQQQASSKQTHAPKDVKPGSYEDWCGEHKVPESQCTRCNPDLIPAFKATNDWCAEHSLPESQCLKCNPTLKIERPAKPAGGG